MAGWQRKLETAGGGANVSAAPTVQTVVGGAQGEARRPGAVSRGRRSGVRRRPARTRPSFSRARVGRERASSAGRLRVFRGG